MPGKPLAGRRDMTHDGAFRAVAYGWVRLRDEQGVSIGWERYLVRHCDCCRAIETVKLLWVNPDYLTCLTCLSQNVEVVKNPAGDVVGLICLDCGFHTELDRPLPIEMEDTDEPDSWLLPPGKDEEPEEPEKPV